MQDIPGTEITSLPQTARLPPPRPQFPWDNPGPSAAPVVPPVNPIPPITIDPLDAGAMAPGRTGGTFIDTVARGLGLAGPNERPGVLTPGESAREGQAKIAEAQQEVRDAAAWLKSAKKSVGTSATPSFDPNTGLPDDVVGRAEDRLERAQKELRKTLLQPDPEMARWRTYAEQVPKTIWDQGVQQITGALRMGQGVIEALDKLGIRQGDITPERRQELYDVIDRSKDTPEDKARARKLIDARFTTNASAGIELTADEKRLENLASGLFQPGKGRADEFGSKIVDGFASTAGFMVSGAAGSGVMKLPQSVTTAVAGALPQAASMYQEATDKLRQDKYEQIGAGAPAGPDISSVSEWRRWAAFAAGLGIGATESIPISHLFERLEKTSGGGLTRLIGLMTAQGGEEALQEGLQTLLEDAAAKGLYDPKKVIGEDLADSMLVGAISGAGMAGTMGARRSFRDARREVNDAVPTPEAPAPIDIPKDGGPSSAQDIDAFLGRLPPAPPQNPAGAAFAGAPARAVNAPLALPAPIPDGFEPFEPPSAGTGPAPSTAPVPEAPAGTAPAAAPGPARAVPADEAGILKAAGFDPDVVAGMSPRERKRLVAQAREDGIEPVDLTDEERHALSGEGTRAAPVRAQTPADVEKAASQAADPTPAQAEAGNYKKGHLDIQGLPVTIETPAGAERRGTDEDGKPWAHKIDSHYGYIKRTTGADGDHVDTYVGPNPQSDSVTIVDQINPKTGKFDEHKVVLGANDETEARRIYEGGFADGSGPSRIGGMVTMPVSDFKGWLANGDQTKPAAPAHPVGEKPAGVAPSTEQTGTKAEPAPVIPATPNGRTKAEPRTLGAFLASRGGLKPHAELDHMGLRSHFVPGHGRLVRKSGMDLDTAREAAVQAGFLPDAPYAGGNATSRVNDLLDALDKEARGSRQARIGDEAEQHDRDRRRDPAEEHEQARQAIIDAMADAGLPERELNRRALDRAAALVVRGDVFNLDDAYERAIMSIVAEEEDLSDRVERDNAGIDMGEWVQTAPPEGWDDETTDAGAKAERGPVPESDGGRIEKPAGRADQSTGERADGAGPGAAAGRPEAGGRGAPAGGEEAVRVEPGADGKPAEPKRTTPQDIITYTSPKVRDLEAVLEAKESAWKRAIKVNGRIVDAEQKAARERVGPEEDAFDERDILDMSEEGIEAAREIHRADKAVTKATQDLAYEKISNNLPEGYYATREVYGGNSARAWAKRVGQDDHYKIEIHNKDGGVIGAITAAIWRSEVTNGWFPKWLANPSAKTVGAQALEAAREASGVPDGVTDINWERARGDLEEAAAAIDESGNQKPSGEVVDFRPAPRKADEREQIGENPFGHPVFEDERGVRSYVADGIRLTEKVRIEPGGGVSINRSDRTDAFLTKEEAAAIKGEIASRSMRDNVEAFKAEGRTWAEVLHALDSKSMSTADLTELVRLWNRGGETPAATGAEKVADLSTAFRDHFAGKKGFKNILEARRFAKEHDGTTDTKVVEEAMEAGIVAAARQIVDEAKTPAQAFNRLVAMYERQPILGTRTSTSVRDQAYSTPVPLAYVAAKLAGIGAQTTVFEPTAGNGALLITATPKNVTANELNAGRAAALRAQGFGVVREENAADGAFRSVSTDVVIANPPFGPIKDKMGASRLFDMGDIQPGYQTREIDHVISLNALASMADRGRAVLIIGAPSAQKDRSEGYNGKAKREFFKVLYDRYNVVDHFTVSGDLYAKQGASWPVDVIVIDGRGASSRRVPAADVPAVINSWADLKEKLNVAPGDTHSRVEQARGTPFVPDSTRAPVADEPDRKPAGAGVAPVQQPAAARPADVLPGRDREQHGSQDGDAAALGRAERAPSADADRADRVAPAERRPQRIETAEGTRQVAYTPGSTKTKGLGTLVPVNMKSATDDALDAVRERRGDLDAYVGRNLKMQKGENLGDYFGAEQIDALALGMDNAERGSALIIGDQTGIGKGRVNAGMIRYALAAGRIPVFYTQEPSLYKAMYDDLTDIGIQTFLGREPSILMTDAAKSIPLNDEKKLRLRTPDAKTHNAALEALARGGGIGDYDMVFTTYSGAQTLAGKETERQRFIRAIAPNSLVIMDESHNAGGTGPSERGPGKNKDGTEKAPGRAEFLRGVIDLAPAAFYSSATYAKRPDVMDLYRKTDMRLAVEDIAELGPAIQAGGVPLQQAVASMLAKAGQMVRRERSFEGIPYDVVKVPADRGTYDGFSASLAAILAFSRHVNRAAKEMDAEMREDATRAGTDSAVGEGGATSTNFTSIMHNLIGQMLLSIKAEETAQRAIAHAKAGRKVVIALSNTNESFLADYAEQTGLQVGEAIDIDFGSMLNRYLDRSRVITIKKPFMRAGEQAEKKVISLEEMDPAMRAAYRRAAEIIKGIDFGGMPVSPIDHIKARIAAAGLNVGEITGRNLTVDYSGTTARLAARSTKERSTSGKVAARDAFNGGDMDVIILNQSGSTGISLHASERFKDKRQRVMLIAQAAGDINTHMQMLGRVHRTGQVVLPAFEQLAADIPAEIRPAAVLAKKMASLNANTTAARDSAFTSDETPDFINEYGDVVALRVMMDEIELNEAMGNPIGLEEKTSMDGAIRKLTGRIPLLPLSEQERLYGRLTDSYQEMIAELDAAGQNMLEAKTLDLDAKLVTSAEVQEKRGPSPFQDAVVVSTYDVKRLGKPYTSADVLNDVSKAAGLPIPDPSKPAASLTALAREAQRDHAKMMDAEEKAFRAYRDEYLRGIEDPERADAQRVKLNDIERRWGAIGEKTAPGARVRLTFQGGETGSGVVLRTSHSGKTKNPLALGSWKVRIAYSGAGRTVEFPYSQIIADGSSVDSAPMGTVGIAPMDWGETPAQTLEGFDIRSGVGARENRVIATGNLLAAFTKVRGQIINFTTADGEIRQGILAPAKMEMDDVLAKLVKTLEKPKEVVKQARDNPGTPLTTSDGALSIVADKYGYITFSAEKARNRGGKYYLNEDVTLETGDFSSRGGRMVAPSVAIDRAVPAVRALQAAGARFQVQVDPEDMKTSAAKIEAQIEAQAPKGRGETGGDGRERSSHVWDSGNGKILLSNFKGMRSEAERVAITAQVGKIIAEVAPANTELFVVDEAGVSGAAMQRGYGQQVDPNAYYGVQGAFISNASVAAIVVSMTSRDRINTAFHEAWHAIKKAMGVGAAEQRVLDRERPRLYALIQASGTHHTLAELQAMSQEEVEAQAAGAWGAGVRVGQHFVVARFLEAMSRLISRVRNLLAGYGYRSYEDVFSDFTSGKLKQRADAQTARPAQPTVTPEAPQARIEAMAQPAAPASPTAAVQGLATPASGRVRNLIGRMLDSVFSPERRDIMLENYQNFLVYQLRLKEALEQRQNAPLSTSRDFYTKRRLFESVKDPIVEEFDRTLRKRLFDAFRDSGMTMKEIDDGLYARHAPERNAEMDRINPPGWYAQGRGSGMSDAEAQAILRKLQANGQDIALDRIADAIRDIQTFTLDTLEDGGILTPAQRAEWESAYQHYVPLRGFEDPVEASRYADTPKGNGAFRERGRASPEALGRRSKADSPIVNVLDQAYRAIHRAERNKVLQSLWSALKSFRPGDISDLVTLDRGQMIRVRDAASGMVREIPDPRYTDDPKAVGVKIGGKQHWMLFSSPDTARSVMASSPDGMWKIFEGALRITRFLNRWRTTYQPDFLVTQFLFRGPQQAIANFLANKEDRKVSLSRFAAAGIPFFGKASRAIMRAQAGKPGTGIYDKYWQEMRAAGGAMSFRGMNNPDAIRGDFLRALDEVSGNPLKRARAKLRAFRRIFEHMTDMLDNSYRLAGYVQMREAGEPAQKAAIEARDLLGDFGLRGRKTNAMTLWFEFFNAGVQALTVSVQRTRRSKHVQALLVGLVVFGAVSELFNYVGGGDDDDGTPFIDKQADHERNAKRIIMLPWLRDANGKPREIKIPIEFFFAFPINVGASLVQAFYSKRSAGKIGTELFKSALESLNPLGGSGYDNLMSKLTPSLGRPAVEIKMNANFANIPIHSRRDRDPKPVSEQGRRTTGAGWKAVASSVNYATGGNQFEPGAISLYPEDYRHLFDFAFGAQRRTAFNVAETVGSLRRGEAPAAKTTPMARVVTGHDYDAADRSAFYEARREVYDARSAIKAAMEARNQTAAADARRRLAPQVAFIKAFEQASKNTGQIAKRIEQIDHDTSMSAPEREHEIKKLEREQLKMMNRVRVDYEKRKRQKENP